MKFRLTTIVDIGDYDDEFMIVDVPGDNSPSQVQHFRDHFEDAIVDLCQHPRFRALLGRTVNPVDVYMEEVIE